MEPMITSWYNLFLFLHENLIPFVIQLFFLRVIHLVFSGKAKFMCICRIFWEKFCDYIVLIWCFYAAFLPTAIHWLVWWFWHFKNIVTPYFNPFWSVFRDDQSIPEVDTNNIISISTFGCVFFTREFLMLQNIFYMLGNMLLWCLFIDTSFWSSSFIG